MPQNYTAVESAYTRPADTTPYTSGDLVANSTTAGSVTALSFTISGLTKNVGMVRFVRLRTNNATVANGAFRVHLFNSTPLAPTNGDNGAFVPNGISGYLGSADITLIGGVSAGGGVVTAAIPVTGCTADVVYGLLEARGAYVPASGEVVTVQVTVEISY